jgi:MFS family permease
VRPVDNSSPGTPDRWYLLSYVATTYFAIYAHRNLINYIQPSLMASIGDGGLGLDESQLAWVGPAWQLPYCFSQLFAGYLSDRFSRRRVILWSLLASSACLAAMGLVSNLSELLVGRALLGLAQACSVPAMAGAIADCFRPHTRSKAMAFYLFSYNAAVIVAGKYGGAIADLPAQHIPGTPASWSIHGWRLSHFIFAAGGLLAWVVLLKVLREPVRTERREHHGLGTTGGSIWQTLGQVFRVPSFHLMYLVFCCAGIVIQLSRFWFPQRFYKIFHESLGWNQEDIGSFSTFWIQIGSMTGLLLGGLLADRLVRQTFRGRVWVQLAGWLLLTPCLVVIGTQESPLILRVAMLLMGLGLGAFQANFWTASFDVIDPAARSTAIGLFNLSSGLLVSTWIDPFLGWLEADAQQQGESILGTVIVSVSGVGVAAIALLVALLWWTLPRDHINHDSKPPDVTP